jgi:hypothetical protein
VLSAYGLVIKKIKNKNNGIGFDSVKLDVQVTIIAMRDQKRKVKTKRKR